GRGRWRGRPGTGAAGRRGRSGAGVAAVGGRTRAGTKGADGMGGAVVAVVGARGGAGASVVAASLGRAAGRRRGPVGLVDLALVGGGLDVLLGVEQDPGVRWPDLADARGRLDGEDLLARLPRWASTWPRPWDGTARSPARSSAGRARAWGAAPSCARAGSTRRATLGRDGGLACDVARPARAGTRTAARRRPRPSRAGGRRSWPGTGRHRGGDARRHGGRRRPARVRSRARLDGPARAHPHGARRDLRRRAAPAVPRRAGR